MWQRNQSFIHRIQQAVSIAEVFACYNQGNSSLQTLKETRPWICNIVQVKQNMKFPIWNTNSRDSRLAQCSCKYGKKGWAIINSNSLDLTTTDQWQKRTLGYISLSEPLKEKLSTGCEVLFYHVEKSTKILHASKHWLNSLLASSCSLSGPYLINACLHCT